eukprot:CAMPEP_0118645600 /NCGR_PEP_ID=MMETSP0785-20121206/7592_1 /TAXON_ID=91992 /ORGANISM="Bolidomonas pacifica, Strain CCMP 1866" /LENGTH=61 /DNA_ID=CAMNT_0006537503 /DNA_START=844 /DNA_END=1026 /DNA_ORIENTATION=+
MGERRGRRDGVRGWRMGMKGEAEVKGFDFGDRRDDNERRRDIEEGGLRNWWCKRLRDDELK